MTSEDFNKSVTVGRVADAFGVRGWVKVQSFTDDPENIRQYSRWILTPKSGVSQSQTVLSSKVHGKFVTAKLEGIESRDQALALKGSEIRIPIADFPDLPEGEYYHFQLLGLETKDVDGRVYGCVDRVMQTGANDVLVVQGKDTFLIPYIPQVIKNIDLNAGVILVEWHFEY